MSADTALRAAFSRRTFLQSVLAGSAAVALSGTVSTRIAMAADPSYDGDVLVVLSLRGGFDGLNAVVPAGDPNYLVARPRTSESQAMPCSGWTPCSDCIPQWRH